MVSATEITSCGVTIADPVFFANHWRRVETAKNSDELILENKV
jgi:hypothetical protein